MKDTANQQKLRELIRDIQFAMLTTVDKDGALHSRPMTLLDSGEGQRLYFLTSVDTAASHDINVRDAVNVSFADPHDNRFVSVSGHASVSQNRQEIERLWSPMHKAWFPEGKDDPKLAVLCVTMDHAEFWDSASAKMVQIAGFVKSLLTGKAASPGEHGKVRGQRPDYPDAEYQAPAHMLEEDSPQRPQIIAPIEESTD